MVSVSQSGKTTIHSTTDHMTDKNHMGVTWQSCDLTCDLVIRQQHGYTKQVY